MSDMRIIVMRFELRSIPNWKLIFAGKAKSRV